MANEGAKAGDDAGEDPLNFRPNPEALVSKVDEAGVFVRTSTSSIPFIYTTRLKAATFTRLTQASHPPLSVCPTGCLAVCIHHAF